MENMPVDMGNPYAIPIPMQTPINDAAFIAQINPNQVLEVIEHQLKGEVWNSVDEKWEKKYNARINDNGIAWILSLLSVYVNQNTTLSNLKDTEISRLMKPISMSIFFRLAVGHKEFGIERKNLTSTAWSITDIIYLTLKRSLMQGERGFVKGIQTSSEIVHKNEMQPRKSKFLGLIK